MYAPVTSRTPTRHWKRSPSRLTPIPAISSTHSWPVTSRVLPTGSERSLTAGAAATITEATAGNRPLVKVGSQPPYAASLPAPRLCPESSVDAVDQRPSRRRPVVGSADAPAEPTTAARSLQRTGTGIGCLGERNLPITDAAGGGPIVNGVLSEVPRQVAAGPARGCGWQGRAGPRRGSRDRGGWRSPAGEHRTAPVRWGTAQGESGAAAALQRAQQQRAHQAASLLHGARFKGLDALLCRSSEAARGFEADPMLSRLAFLVTRSAADFETATEATLSGYLSVAVDAMRDVMEIENLLLDFAVSPAHIDEWLAAGVSQAFRQGVELRGREGWLGASR